MYCVKCKTQREGKNYQQTKDKRGREVMKAVCEVCGSKMSHLVKTGGSSADDRLDKLVPVYNEVIGRLLAAKGMLRYRKGFVEKVKEIME